MDTLWNRLTRDRWEQARQLTINRSSAMITLSPPTAEDCRLFLEKRLGDSFTYNPAEHSDALAALATASEQKGAFSFLRRVAKGLSNKTEAITAETIGLSVRAAERAIKSNRC